jgi:ribosomal protein S18 acetylase RimI-like enzyme
MPTAAQRTKASIGRLRRRTESAQDAAFRFELFRQSRVGGEYFSFLPSEMRQMVLRQQFLAQDAGYRGAFPDARFEIVEYDARPVGRIVTARVPEAIYILDMAMLPEWRSRGIGSAILQEIGDLARAAGIAMRFDVLLSNHAALRLFQRLGFKPVARSEVFMTMEAPALAFDESNLSRSAPQ